MPIKRGIYLVANQYSEWFCENLIQSIRNSGCLLPIRLIHFGGTPVQSVYIKGEVELLDVKDFPAEAVAFVDDLQSVLTNCPRGFLYRFLAWFSDWDEFIYTDNDVIALSNWNVIFDHLQHHDLVHADEEYTTQGKYNYDQPEAIEQIFGTGSLLTAVTAGHFAARRSPQLIANMRAAIQWFRNHPEIPKKHDQALMHVASLLGNWNMLNLCRPPHNWLSSWAGDYKNTLALIHAMHNQGQPRSISHLHYSGGTPNGVKPIDDFIFASRSPEFRLKTIINNGLKQLYGVYTLLSVKKKVMKRLKRMTSK
jgi:hypothetical protein